MKTYISLDGVLGSFFHVDSEESSDPAENPQAGLSLRGLSDFVTQKLVLLWIMIVYEPCHEKTCFLHMRKTKAQISCVVTVQLISDFVFAT